MVKTPEVNQQVILADEDSVWVLDNFFSQLIALILLEMSDGVFSHKINHGQPSRLNRSQCCCSKTFRNQICYRRLLRNCAVKTPEVNQQVILADEDSVWVLDNFFSQVIALILLEMSVGVLLHKINHG